MVEIAHRKDARKIITEAGRNQRKGHIGEMSVQGAAPNSA
jgi:hypothetical protein